MPSAQHARASLAPGHAKRKPAKRTLAPKPRHVYRSAVTGRFVTAAYAKRYPKRTVRERVEVGCP